MSINLNGKHHELIDMDEQNEEDSVSVVNVVKNEEIEGANQNPIRGRIPELGLISLGCYLDKNLREWPCVPKLARKRGRK